jgi:phage shock protein A
MSLFFRWTHGFASRIDAMVKQIENHDALVSAAVRDAKEARARARVQLARVREDGRRMQRRCTELEEAERRWRERAQRIGDEDEERALECVRRMKRAAREREQLVAQAGEHERIEGQLTRDIKSIDGRIESLVQQRNLLRTRQSRAEALAAAHQDDGRRLAEVDDILERWEVKVSVSETDLDCSLGEEDDLELELAGAEEREELRAELDELLRDPASAGPDATQGGAS